MLSEAELACPLAKVGIYSLPDTVVTSQSTKSRLGFVNPGLFLLTGQSSGPAKRQQMGTGRDQREGTVWCSLCVLLCWL